MQQHCQRQSRQNLGKKTAADEFYIKLISSRAEAKLSGIEKKKNKSIYPLVI